MPIALERTGDNSIQRSQFVRQMPRISLYASPEANLSAGDARLPAERQEQGSDSCSSSSIGRNSEASGVSSDSEDLAENEVQSSLKGPLDTMDFLEEVLPIKRGISKFYNGKSKSFTSLADAFSASSVKEFAKPENHYTKKRKNLLAHGNFWDKNRSSSARSKGCGIPKRLTNSCRSTPAFGAMVIGSESNNNSDYSSSNSFSPSRRLPPLHPQAKRIPASESTSPPPRRNSPWRSFSLSDLHCIGAATTSIDGS